jgi:hypothetical protein
LDDTDPKLFAVLLEWLYNTTTLPCSFFGNFSLALMVEFQNYIGDIIAHMVDILPNAEVFDQYVKVAGPYAEEITP